MTYDDVRAAVLADQYGSWQSFALDLLDVLAPPAAAKPAPAPPAPEAP